MASPNVHATDTPFKALYSVAVVYCVVTNNKGK